MHKTMAWFTSAAAVVLLLAGAPARANTTICVSSGSAIQLNNALHDWESARDQTYYVHVEQGVYDLVANSDTDPALAISNFDQYGALNGGDGNASLHLVGGFAPGTNCSKRSIDASNTAIRGTGTVKGLLIRQLEGDLLIDGITFTSLPRGLQIGSASDSSVVLRNIVVSNNGNGNFYYPALLVTVYNSGWFNGGTTSIRIENCVVAHNHTYGLQIRDLHDTDSTQVIGCTIADNDAYGFMVDDPDNSYAGAAGGLQGTLAVFNTIFYNNNPAFADVYVHAGKSPGISYSNLASISGAAITSNNHDVDPKFVDAANGNYDLDPGSPLINIGAAASLVSGGYATTDIRGRTRVIPSAIDLGAYESAVNPKAPQVVQTDSDSIGNTLRAAISAANGDPNPTTITFAVPGDCSVQTAYITLGSLLPDITSDITIDGYTQPGAKPNDIAPGYDGNICVVIDGGGLDHAFTTSGSGRLTVRGIDFENFSGAAVRLASGSGHVVTGNAFGNSPVGVWIQGSATGSRIGSYAFGDRNYFDGMTDAALKLTGNGAGNHVIQGNYLGFYLVGINGIGNHYGIYATDSGSNEISYNFIGNTALEAIRLSGSAASAYHIIENAIGIAPYDGSAAGGGTGGSGCTVLCGGLPAIEMVDGAHDNYIGAIGGSGGNNYIANNDGPGVAVDATAGVGNRIFGNNLIHDNNGYLAIDLGGPGANANDVGDGDVGGNDLQNYPLLSAGVRIEANVIRISGFLPVQNPGPAQTYRLDFFWTDSCVPGDVLGPRGELKGYVGFMTLYATGTTNYSTFSNADLIAAGRPPAVAGKSYFLSATATDASGNTSEPGPCVAYIDDYIFSNGFN